MKKGDTLIEVTIAIGIFSLIAIGVASVTSSGLAGSQSALETTLAREEIDTQAEAIRFIHDAYISDKGTGNSTYSKIWNKIISSTAFSPYSVPSSCADLYQGGSSGLPNYAFVLNPRNLNDESTYINYEGNNKSKFEATPTYPRLLYGSTGTNSDPLVNSTTSTTLSRAQGIYVIPVRGTDATIIGTSSGSAAYYDFYIHTCWYGLDNETPSTVSTVIRLYNTPVADTPTYSPDYTSFLHVMYNSGSNDSGPILRNSIAGFPSNQRIETAGQFVFPTLGEPYNELLLGWRLNGESTIHSQGSSVEIPDLTNGSQTWNIEAVWDTSREYRVIFDADGGSFADADPTGRKDQIIITCKPLQDDINCLTNYTIPDVYLDDSSVTKSGYKFLGWATVKGATDPVYTAGGKKKLGKLSGDVTLYAVWEASNETYRIELTWGSTIDYDSYIYGQKMDGSYFTAYYGNKSPTETVDGVTRTLAELDHDCTGSCRNETFVINTLGGKDFYYYVRNYSSNSKIVGATVVLKRQKGDGWEQVGDSYQVNSATGSGRIWNVFAYKNGKIVRHNKCSSEPELSY